MAERWRYTRGDHPSTCTCVDCTQERLKRARDKDKKTGGVNQVIAPVLDPLRRLLNRLTRALR